MSQRMKTVVVAIIALLLVFSLVIPAFAHAQLLSSSPANGASLPTADELVLTFNEDVSPDFVTFYAEGDSEGVLDGEASVDGPVVTQPLSPAANGEYAIGYRVVSADGHPVSGEITFTLTDVPATETTEPETTEPVPTTEAEQTTEDSTPEATSAETATPEEQDQPDPADQAAESTNGDGGSRWVLFGVIFAITFGLTLLFMWMRSRRNA